MLYHAKSGRLKPGGTEMDYVSSGSGEKVLAMPPGLGDGPIEYRWASAKKAHRYFYP